jgi:hypothetical protein
VFATGRTFEGDDSAYQRLRRELLDQANIRDKMPEFVRRYHDLGRFWQFIKRRFKHYAERREFIWGSFGALIDYLEGLDRSPDSQRISETLQAFDPDSVHVAWQKALDRRVADPEGAIAARNCCVINVVAFELRPVFQAIFRSFKGPAAENFYISMACELRTEFEKSGVWRSTC